MDLHPSVNFLSCMARGPKVTCGVDGVGRIRKVASRGGALRPSWIAVDAGPASRRQREGDGDVWINGLAIDLLWGSQSDLIHGFVELQATQTGFRAGSACRTVVQGSAILIVEAVDVLQVKFVTGQIHVH